MRLYKMEIYKLCSRKIFIIGTVSLFLLMLFTFWSCIAGTETTVNGMYYTGYKAVLKDREITEEFKGTLTDEKARQIIEKYGFPHKVARNYRSFQDTNFLNEFIMEYLSDGYIENSENYKIATQIYPIEETEIGEISNNTGREIILEYTDGWEAFFSVLTVGLGALSILILFSITPVFSEESQTGMLPVLFTTKEGKNRDISAKIAAVLTVTAALFLTIVLLALFLCRAVFGLDGLDCLTGTIYCFSNALRATMLPLKTFIVFYVITGFLGILLLCSVTMYISASFQSSFHAIAMAVLYWMSPILIRLLMNLFLFILYATPLYMIMPDVVIEIYNNCFIIGIIVILVTTVCLIRGYEKYKTLE